MPTTLVIGAHGKVGQLLVRQLAQKGHTVLAGFRKEDQFNTVKDIEHITPVLFDLQAGPEEMVLFYQQHHVDQIVFTAGAGGASDALTIQVDLDGAVKAMDAANIAGIKRFVMVSAAGADLRNQWAKSGIYNYYVMKHYADRILQTSDLDYTIVRPVTLSDRPATGKLSLDVDLTKKGLSVSRADVADFVTLIIDNLHTSRKIYDITSGDTAIDQLSL